MERSPQVIIEETEQVQDLISLKELELESLKNKLTKLNLELADATYFDV